MKDTTEATQHATREAWLIAAGKLTAELVQDRGPEVPSTYVSVGFPKGAGAKARGQCWDPVCSVAGVHHIFIAPSVSDPLDALAVLIHEQIHAAVGIKHKHRGEFSRVAKLVGLLPKWTQANPGPDLLEQLKAIMATVGEYPHDKLSMASRKAGTAGSRYRLFQCACGIKVRAARDELKAACMDCGSQFERQGVTPDPKPETP